MKTLEDMLHADEMDMQLQRVTSVRKSSSKAAGRDSASQPSDGEVVDDFDSVQAG